ncbi:MAG: radical SAM protein [Kiritimatiellae bacterium]|nr:radical SAM protein [Kiritimatiellia bacterium]
MRTNQQMHVGLVQIGERFGSQYYLPYAIGLLQAYAQEHLSKPERYLFRPPIYKGIGVDRAAVALQDADIVFFSAYVWNHSLSLAIARKIRQQRKHSVIVFGGPQVPESEDALGAFLERNPFVDIGCYGEGELPFLRILENLHTRAWTQVPSIGFVNADKRFVYNPATEKLKDVNDIPSPYLTGVFEPLFRQNPGEGWSGLLETNRGCPFSCAYCYWGKSERNRVRQFQIDRVFSEIDWISRNKIQFVFCCDGNFGLLKRDRDIAAKVAGNRKAYGYPHAFSVQNTKNATHRIFALQKILSDAGLQKGVNLALQSVNDATLKSIHRSNISFQSFQDLQRLFSKAGIATFSDMIIALPEESYDTFADGVARVIAGGQHNRIQFINLVVLENTLMADPAYQRRHGLALRKSRVTSHHTSLDATSEVAETQDLVVGTATMPETDWIRTRVFCWLVSLLHFNKLLQIPFILINRLASVSFRRLAEVFMTETGEDECSRIARFLFEKAGDVQRGRGEYVASRERLNIWWPADEFMLIELCATGKLTRFYEEARIRLGRFVADQRIQLPAGLLEESIALNHALLKQPFQETDLDIVLSYSILDVYRATLNGETIRLDRASGRYRIDRTSETWDSWETWCREMVWYQKKQGTYLYPCRPLDARDG